MNADNLEAQLEILWKELNQPTPIPDFIYLNGLFFGRNYPGKVSDDCKEWREPTADESEFIELFRNTLRKG